MSQKSLVSISEASHILGVSEAAIRQWTDEGKIRAFLTSGGHRRCSKTELKKFAASSRKVLSIKDLVVQLEDTVPLHREITRAHLNTTSWYNKINQESQEHLADPGGRFLAIIIRYITEPSKREETLKLARDVGHSYGETLAKLELPLTASVEAFILHREPIMNATTPTDVENGGIYWACHGVDIAVSPCYERSSGLFGGSTSACFKVSPKEALLRDINLTPAV